MIDSMTDNLKTATDITKKGSKVSLRSEGIISTNRADWHFGELLEWHLKRGTRPGGEVTQTLSPWTYAEFAREVGVHAKTVSNWLQSMQTPQMIIGIERALFGIIGRAQADPYSDWRRELQQAHKKTVPERPIYKISGIRPEPMYSSLKKPCLMPLARASGPLP